jgi:flagellar motor switch protein FliM
LLDGLGKFTMGKACIYVKKLSDIDQKVLLSLMKHTIKHLKKTYGKS